MEFFAQTDVSPTTVIGLLSLVITAVLSGVGWAGARLLGKGGLVEESNKALTAVADCVKQHDTRSKESNETHSKSCEAAAAHVSTMHNAAIIGCDEIERMCQRHGLECQSEFAKIREALKA